MLLGLMILGAAWALWRFRTLWLALNVENYGIACLLVALAAALWLVWNWVALLGIAIAATAVALLVRAWRGRP